jgi:hypothetical protein
MKAGLRFSKPDVITFTADACEGHRVKCPLETQHIPCLLFQFDIDAYVFLGVYTQARDAYLNLAFTERVVAVLCSFITFENLLHLVGAGVAQSV